MAIRGAPGPRARLPAARRAASRPVAARRGAPRLPRGRSALRLPAARSGLAGPPRRALFRPRPARRPKAADRERAACRGMTPWGERVYQRAPPRRAALKSVFAAKRRPLSTGFSTTVECLRRQRPRRAQIRAFVEKVLSGTLVAGPYSVTLVVGRPVVPHSPLPTATTRRIPAQRPFWQSSSCPAGCQGNSSPPRACAPSFEPVSATKGSYPHVPQGALRGGPGR